METLPHLLLTFPIPRDGEGHQLIQGHTVLGVDVQQLGRHRGQPQPLLHDADRDEERGRDLLLGLALLAQAKESSELVQRVQRCALHVLGQAVLLGDPVGADHAGDRRRFRQALLLDQQFQRAKPTPARRDLIHAGLLAVRVQYGTDGDGLQQGPPRDVVGELLDNGHARLDPADVAAAQQQLVEGNVARGAEGDLLDGACHGPDTPRRAGWEPLSKRSTTSRTPRPTSSSRKLWTAGNVDMRERKVGQGRGALLPHSGHQLGGATLQLEPGILVRLAAGQGGDALYEVEHALRWPTFF